MTGQRDGTGSVGKSAAKEMRVSICPTCGSPLPVRYYWTWEAGTPRERGEIIRQHRIRMSNDDICALFGLTETGADAILNGADWHPRHTLFGAREP